MPNPSAQRHFLVKVSGIDGNFMTKSGGNISSAPTKVWPGGENVPDILAAPPEADNITVGRAFDVERDQSTIINLRQQIGRLRATVSVTPTDINMVAIGEPAIYPNALLIGISEPDMDSSSGDAAMWELEFAIAAFR